jgi:tol-pal system protein YbgF
MGKINWVKGWFVLWAGLFLYGCATTQDVQIIDGEVHQIHSQLNTIQKEKDSIKNELAAFQKESQKDISSLQTESKRLQADLLIRLENLQSEIRILSTSVDEYKEFLSRPSKEIERVREDIAIRTRLLEERGKTFEEKNRAQDERTKALEEKMKAMEDRLKGVDGKIGELVSKVVEIEKPASGKEPPVETKGISPGVGTLYKDAYETFQRGDLEGARRKFEIFLKQYPNTELSNNAQFWIGETYYMKKDFERAILEYEKAIAKYPEGDKIPAVLFKQALAFLELGDKTNARNILRRLIERYPQSDQAETARKKLEAIK